MCNEQGGQCSGCMNADPDAYEGYCCSGANHHGGGGPAANGDCPADAIAAVSTTVHSCVVKKKGIIFDSGPMNDQSKGFSETPHGHGHPQNRQNSYRRMVSQNSILN